MPMHPPPSLPPSSQPSTQHPHPPPNIGPGSNYFGGIMNAQPPPGLAVPPPPPPQVSERSPSQHSQQSPHYSASTYLNGQPPYGQSPNRGIPTPRPEWGQYGYRPAVPPPQPVESKRKSNSSASSTSLHPPPPPTPPYMNILIDDDNHRRMSIIQSPVSAEDEDVPTIYREKFSSNQETPVIPLNERRMLLLIQSLNTAEKKHRLYFKRPYHKGQTQRW
ncbi:hypothetical protein G6F68_012536 [Rhizopus microsporus]|nr:hypothetical protein G6F68_012536 [Rhizopus microsporus]